VRESASLLQFKDANLKSMLTRTSIFRHPPT